MEPLDNLPKIKLKSHQYSALIFISGVFVGMCLHYLFFRTNMDYVKKQAYSEGKQDAREEIIQGILEADTTLLTQSGIQFIYK